MPQDNPLNIVQQEQLKTDSWVSQKQTRRQELQAHFDREWLLNPEQFDTKNCLDEERIARTVALISEYTSLANKHVADLGSGDGRLTTQLSHLGAKVDAVDISSYAEKALGSADIRFYQDYVPRTRLRDDFYDLVVSCELIGYIPKQEHRLFLLELSRIVKPGAYVVCSTELDPRSEEPLQAFAQLINIEFRPEKWVISHHRLYQQLLNFIYIPSKYQRAGRDLRYKTQEMEKCRGLSHWWFSCNSSPVPAYLWGLIARATYPIWKAMRRSRTLLLLLEKVCRLLLPKRGITHAIWIGPRRPLVKETPLADRPHETKHKKQVWE